ncbi:homing endonuclease associated repeat-containing protein [Halorubrum lipolyticum]|uniref:Uncharacterized protein n=1 Tax=Halorubrum lipolyticum DSM 21995 TaxID=1227482 RepID=M0P0N6_9EURY|nr:hypothetical protein [Halorubrum lipolyticum]EMA63737.1 hypothetical protein C469_02741 [Halorubrum lipolyticum DSM 21995]
MSDSEYSQHQRNCLDGLHEAAEIVGESPTVREYDSLDVSPSSTAIKNAFGSWNDAKRAADLDIRSVAGHSRVSINETYFETIDTDEKAYWLGVLFSRSTISEQGNNGRALQLGRTGDKRYYVTEFAAAVDSDYSINEFETPESVQATTLISNAEFLDVLADHGLTDSARNVATLPPVPDEHRRAMVRAVLENIGNLGVDGGWTIRGRDGGDRLEQLKEWIDTLDVKHSNLSTKSGSPILYVSNTMDAAKIFEAAWPEGVATAPANPSVARTYAERIVEEHPFPETLSFTPLGEGSESDESEGVPETTGSDDAQPVEDTGSNVDPGSQVGGTEETGEVVVPLSVDTALLLDTLALTTDRSRSDIAADAVRSYLGGLLSGHDPNGDFGATAGVVDRSLNLPNELLQIVATTPDNLPLRNVVEPAIRSAHSAETAAVTLELPPESTSEIPTTAEPIADALLEVLNDD